jgi:hypothetical protein
MCDLLDWFKSLSPLVSLLLRVAFLTHPPSLPQRCYKCLMSTLRCYSSPSARHRKKILASLSGLACAGASPLLRFRSRPSAPSNSPASMSNNTITTSELFNDPQADIILESFDLTQYRVRKIHLQGQPTVPSPPRYPCELAADDELEAANSSVLDDMFAVASQSRNRNLR